MKSFLALAIIALATIEASSQAVIMERLRLQDVTTGKGISLSKPTGSVTGQVLNFPSAAGAAGQILSITSISGSTVNLGWVTESASSSTSSARVALKETKAMNAVPDGVAKTGLANKNYRITGVLFTNRVSATGASADDKLKVRLTAPSGATGATYVSLAVRCLGCPAGTTGLPAFPTPGTAEVTTGSINPAGATDTFTKLALGIDGLVKMGTVDGDIRLTALDDGSGNSGTEIHIDSYILLTEIE